MCLPNNGNGKVDDDRCMVGGASALTLVSVDVGVGHGVGEGCVGIHQVDALTAVLGKREGAVVPVGEGHLVLQRPRIHIAQPDLPQRCERGTFAFGDMGAPDERGDVPGVGCRWG